MRKDGEALEVSDVPGRSVAVPELNPSSPMCEKFENFRVGSDVDSCGCRVSVGSIVSVVSGTLLASCDADICSEELCLSERREETDGAAWWVFFGSKESVLQVKRQPCLERIG